VSLLYISCVLGLQLCVFTEFSITYNNNKKKGYHQWPYMNHACYAFNQPFELNEFVLLYPRYAHYLFDNESYEEAMEHFLASQIDITYVLSLYPSIILPKTTMIPEPEKLVDISWDVPYLSRTSSGLSDDMEAPSPQQLESDENAALDSKKMSHNTLMALIKFLQKKRYSIIEKATAEGTEEVVLDAVGDNFVSYDSSRFKKSTKVSCLFSFLGDSTILI
jgi:hypothetical protein